MKLNNKFFRTVSGVLASAMIAAVLLTGCGGDAPASSTPASSKPAASQPASSKPASSTPASSKPTTPEATTATMKITIANPQGIEFGNNQYGLGGDLVLTNTSSSSIKVSGTYTQKQWEDASDAYLENHFDEFLVSAAATLGKSSLTKEEFGKLISEKNAAALEVFKQYVAKSSYYGLKTLGNSTFTAKTSKGDVTCVVLRDNNASETLAAGKSMECSIVALTPEIINVEFSYKGTVIKGYSKAEFVNGGIVKMVQTLN